MGQVHYAYDNISAPFQFRSASNCASRPVLCLHPRSPHPPSPSQPLLSRRSSNPLARRFLFLCLSRRPHPSFSLRAFRPVWLILFPRICKHLESVWIEELPASFLLQAYGDVRILRFYRDGVAGNFEFKAAPEIRGMGAMTFD